MDCPQSKFPGAYFDQAKVDEVIGFIEALTLTKCTLSGEPEPFKILPHWREPIERIYGWRRPDGTRVVRKAYLSFGRKQAKTQGAAAIATYEFFMGDQARQEIYFAASSSDQAAICFSAAMDMVNADEELESVCKITPSIKKAINLENGNILRVLSAEGKRQHGLNPSLVIFDELHAWGATEAELHAALVTGSKSRREPLWITITTAGTDQESICGQEYDYAKRVLGGQIEDPTYLAVIYEVPKDADWTDKALWPLALPLLKTGHHKLSDYEEEFTQALQRPEKQNEFRRLYLNQWTSTVTQWLPLATWDDCCEKDPLPDEELVGLECFAGMDLGATGDFSAIVLAFETPDDEVMLRAWGFAPEATIDERSRRDGINYRYWVERGWLILTPGDTIDRRDVFAHLEKLHAKFDIKCLTYDRWKAEYIEDRCEEIRLPLMKFGQGYASMSPAIGVIEELILKRRLKHDGNLCLRWNVDCTQIRTDDASNKKFVKPQLHQKSKHIDLVVAATMATGGMCLVERVVDPYSKGATAAFV